MDTVTLSSKGQLVIPKALREHARLVPGSQRAVRCVDGEIHLTPLTPPGASALAEVAGCLARPGRKALDEAQTRAVIRAKLKARNAP